MKSISGLQKLLLCGILGLSLPQPLYAASDGSIDQSSSGSSDITVDIPLLIKISNVADLTPPEYSGTGNIVVNDPVCIYSNAATSYTIRITGGNPPGTQGAGYFIGNATTDDAIPFTVSWNDEISAGGAALTHGVTLVASQTGFSSAVDCGGTNNANFQVTLTEANLLAATNGIYTNTLTILVTAE